MKKIITLVFTFIALISLSACGSPDELYGYWKSEKNKDFFSGQPKIMVINENTLKMGKDTFKDIALEKENDLWTTGELTKVFGASISYSFKVIDADTLELFENVDKQVKSMGKYIRITEKEAEEILNKKPVSIVKPSVNDPF